MSIHLVLSLSLTILLSSATGFSETTPNRLPKLPPLKKTTEMSKEAEPREEKSPANDDARIKTKKRDVTRNGRIVVERETTVDVRQTGPQGQIKIRTNPDNINVKIEEREVFEFNRNQPKVYVDSSPCADLEEPIDLDREDPIEEGFKIVLNKVEFSPRKRPFFGEYNGEALQLELFRLFRELKNQTDPDKKMYHNGDDAVFHGARLKYGKPDESSWGFARAGYPWNTKFKVWKFTHDNRVSDEEEKRTTSRTVMTEAIPTFPYRRMTLLSYEMSDGYLRNLKMVVPVLHTMPVEAARNFFPRLSNWLGDSVIKKDIKVEFSERICLVSAELKSVSHQKAPGQSDKKRQKK
jgi:hypothetical protein